MLLQYCVQHVSPDEIFSIIAVVRKTRREKRPKKRSQYNGERPINYVLLCDVEFRQYDVDSIEVYECIFVGYYNEN